MEPFPRESVACHEVGATVVTEDFTTDTTVMPTEHKGKLLMALATGIEMLVTHPIIFPMHPEGSLKTEGEGGKGPPRFGRQGVHIHGIWQDFAVPFFTIHSTGGCGGGNSAVIVATQEGIPPGSV